MSLGLTSIFSTLPVTALLIVDQANVEDETTLPFEPIVSSTLEISTVGGLALAVIIILTALIISTLIAVRLYKHRQIYLAHPNLVGVPEEWAKHLLDVSDSMEKLKNSNAKDLNKLTEVAKYETALIKNMVETYMTLQDALNQKDDEIRRLKTGYDMQIFRKFLNRFIRVDQAFKELLGEDEITPQRVKAVQYLMQDALEECGVEAFEPEIGQDYRKTEGLGDHPQHVLTTNDDDEFKISHVIEPGYRLRNGEQFETIKPAKVSIYMKGA